MEEEKYYHINFQNQKHSPLLISTTRDIRDVKRWERKQIETIEEITKSKFDSGVELDSC